MACRTHKWTPDKKAALESALRSSRTRVEAARVLGVSLASMDYGCDALGLTPLTLLGTGEVPQIHKPAAPGLTITELVADRKRRFSRLDQYMEERKLIPVRIKGDLPIGILHFGDPHVDDDGCDLGLLEEHARLVRSSPGLYGATVGDTTNNWVGRLARLYSAQSTTQAEAWMLAEWFVREVRDWLYMVGGNHDLWSGAGDPLRWIAGQAGALYQDSEVRIGLRVGARTVRINCRHDFAGRSQYNPAHGPMKALFFGVRDHLAIAGHTHESAYGVLKDPGTGITMHGVKVAGYKIHDRFALERGFRDQCLGPGCVTVIDPRLPDTHPDLIKVYWDPNEGANYLRYLRQKRRAS